MLGVSLLTWKTFILHAKPPALPLPTLACPPACPPQLQSSRGPELSSVSAVIPLCSDDAS